MKLNKFIQKLKEIEKKGENNMEVIMADNIPVVDPIISENILNKKVVVITDQK